MKNLHRLFIVICLFGLLTQKSFAQEAGTNRIKELYLSGNILTFNDFGFQYKSQLKNGNYFRIGATDLLVNLSKQNPYQSNLYAMPSFRTEFAGDFRIGLEKRAQITDRLSAFYGLDFIAGFGIHRTKTEDPTLPEDLRHVSTNNFNTGFGFNSGFIFKISNEFSAAAEISPRLLYSYSSVQRIEESLKVKDTSQGVSFGFNNQSVKISIIYSWSVNKK
jgi:hypothetical protein